VLAFASTGLGIPLVTFLPTFARDVFGAGPQGYSTMLAVSGGGAVAGALLVAWMGHRPHKGRATLLLLVAMGVFIAGFSHSPWFLVSCAFLFLAGVALVSVFALNNSLVQLLAPEEMRGRVMSIYNVAFRGGMPLGNLVTGFVARAWTPQGAILANGVLLAAVGLVVLLSQRQFRRV